MVRAVSRPPTFAVPTALTWPTFRARFATVALEVLTYLFGQPGRLTVTRTFSSLFTSTARTLYRLAVAPLMAADPRSHWYFNVAFGSAVTRAGAERTRPTVGVPAGAAAAGNALAGRLPLTCTRARW